MLDTHLTPEQEAEEISGLARLMVSKSDKESFGKTEFQVRDLVLRIGAKVYEEHLREKKRLPKVRRDVPDVRSDGGVSRLPGQDADEHPGADLLPAGLSTATVAGAWCLGGARKARKGDASHFDFGSTPIQVPS